MQDIGRFLRQLTIHANRLNFSAYDILYKKVHVLVYSDILIKYFYYSLH